MPRLLRFAAATMAALVLAAPALAEQRPAKAAPHKLPGVEGDYSIVAPAPEPLAVPSDGGYAFKAGNTDIRISGSVSVEIGFAPRGQDQRR